MCPSILLSSEIAFFCQLRQAKVLLIPLVSMMCGFDSNTHLAILPYKVVHVVLSISSSMFSVQGMCESEEGNIRIVGSGW